MSIESLSGLDIEKPLSKKERIWMRDNPEKLCEILKEKNKTAYIFVGKRELSLFPLNALCLRETEIFEN